MQTYVALFRGINVGGNSMLPMTELRAILENLGLQNVRTYIQSGNVVFQSRGTASAQLSAEISAEIHKRRGFTPHILLLTVEEIVSAVESNPFPEAESEPKTLHVSFLASVPEAPDLQALIRLKKENERFELRGRVFYLHAPDGIGRSRLAASVERLLGVAMTFRNWRTVCEVMALARDAG